MKFENRVAVVTGAGGQIGSCICRMFKEAGVRVAATDMTPEIAAKAPCDKAYALDVLDAASVKGAFDAILKDFGKVDILVNCAGVWIHPGKPGKIRFADLEEEDWLNIVRINLEGTMRVTHGIIRHMVANGYGRIVNLGSISGICGLPGCCDYSASKGGVGMFTKTLAMETAKQGITVNSVAPGWVERVRREIPNTWIGRTGDPDEMARAVLFFADDDSGFITGTELPVDGGRVLGPHHDDI